MKKGLTILIAILLMFGMLLACSSAAASDLIVGREVQIAGTGVINADLTLNTEAGFASGIELNERISTPGGGFLEPSLLKYHSTFEVGMYDGNESVNASAEVEYESVAELLNAKRTVYSKSFDLGAVMGMRAIGDMAQDVNIYTDNYGMSIEVGGESVGKLKLFQEVVDVNDHHTVLVFDEIVLDGSFKADWSAFVEENAYPASGGTDWLGCP